MQCTGRHPVFIHLFQLSTIDPPVDGPILYVGTQLASSTKALQQAAGFRMPRGGITGVDIDIASTFNPSPIFLLWHLYLAITQVVICARSSRMCCMS